MVVMDFTVGVGTISIRIRVEILVMDIKVVDSSQRHRRSISLNHFVAMQGSTEEIVVEKEVDGATSGMHAETRQQHVDTPTQVTSNNIPSQQQHHLAVAVVEVD